MLARSQTIWPQARQWVPAGPKVWFRVCLHVRGFPLLPLGAPPLLPKTDGGGGGLLFYLCPTIACLVCHRLNTSPVYMPMVSLLASHLPGLPWEETVSFYLCPTIACLVCHRLNMWHLVYKVVSRHIGGVSAVFWTTLRCDLFWVAMTVSWILSGRRLGLPLDHASFWAHSVQDSWCVKTWKYSLTNVHVV